MLHNINNKNNSKRQSKPQRFLAYTVFVVALVTGQLSVAQEVRQSLDRTFVFGAGHIYDETAQKYLPVVKVAEVDVADRQVNADIIDLEINGADITTCQLSAFGGLYCLDGTIVRNWPASSPADSAPDSIDAVDCANRALGLDQGKSGPCTGMTVDFDGNIWLAGKNKGKTHSLIKLVPLGNESDAPPCTNEVGSYCAHEFASGRPLLVDITPVDGRLEKGFSLPGHGAPLKAIIGLEERKSAVAFLSTGEVVEFASGKQFWGLSGPEQLTSITLLQIAGVDGAAPSNMVLVATSFGRILAYDTSGSQPPVQAFSFVTDAGARSGKAQCNFDEPSFTVRASRRSEIVYASDSQYCSVLALKPVVNSEPFKLEIDPDAGSYSTVMGDKVDQSIVPLGVTVAAGSSINLAGCGVDGCTLVPGAKLVGVKLLPNSPSGMTLFQIQGIPDCRYVPSVCIKILGLDTAGSAVADMAILESLKIILPLSATDSTDPGKQRFNMSPLMPEEITELFPGSMPDLWLPHYLRGQVLTDFVFGGFFGRTQEGVLFTDTFEGVFDVLQLAGAEYDCSFKPDAFLAWDVGATVSERYGSEVTGTDENGNSVTVLTHVATITNSGCGSKRTTDGFWSFKPYNLELTPCTFNPEALDNWEGQGTCEVRYPPLPAEEPDHGVTDVPDDAVYAKLLHVLLDELKYTVDNFACVQNDGGDPTQAPLSDADCARVQSKVLIAEDKFDKCWDAALQPKQSAGDQNCQAFDSQLQALYDDLGSVLYDDFGVYRYDRIDLANRIGELRARTVRMRHILETRFLPSLPDEGFDDLQTLTQ